MNAKVYVLLCVKEGKSEQAVQTLRGKAGVRLLDVLEGPPDVVMMVQARERHRLAELTIEAVASVEHLTEDLQLLPTVDSNNRFVLMKSLRARRTSKEGRVEDSGKRTREGRNK